MTDEQYEDVKNKIKKISIFLCDYYHSHYDDCPYIYQNILDKLGEIRADIVAIYGNREEFNVCLNKPKEQDNAKD